MRIDFTNGDEPVRCRVKRILLGGVDVSHEGVVKLDTDDGWIELTEFEPRLSERGHRVAIRKEPGSSETKTYRLFGPVTLELADAASS